MTKRFYKQASSNTVEGGFAVTLDERTIKTPAGQPLNLPTQALADAVAGEWDAQGDEIEPKSMPMMQLCGTAIDRVPDVRDGLIEGLLRYTDTDLLCYRAGHPADLAAKQHAAWQPLLDWASAELGATLFVAEGIMPVDQDEAAREAFRTVLDQLDNWTLTAVAELVGISGSLVVGLAVLKGRLDVEGAFAVCQLDEDHQIERWGEDAEALEKRDSVERDLINAARFLELLRG